MKLSVKDRLLIKEFLPQKLDIPVGLIVREINERIDFNAEERDRLDLKATVTDKGLTSLTWNQEIELIKDVKFSKSEIALIKPVIADKEAKKELRDENLDLAIKLKEYDPKKDIDEKVDASK